MLNFIKRHMRALSAAVLAASVAVYTALPVAAAEDGASSALSEELKATFTSSVNMLKEDMYVIVAMVIPTVLGVMGLYLVLRFGFNFIKRFAK